MAACCASVSPQTISANGRFHTAAYWLLLALRDTIPKVHALATAEFAALRLRLLKIGARVIETASRVRLAFAAACPEAAGCFNGCWAWYALELAGFPGSGGLDLAAVRHLATVLAGP